MDVRASTRGVYERVLTGVADILLLFFVLCMQLARVLTDIVKAPADVLFLFLILKFLLSFWRARNREREREKKNLTVVYCAWVF